MPEHVDDHIEQLMIGAGLTDDDIKAVIRTDLAKPGELLHMVAMLITQIAVECDGWSDHSESLKECLAAVCMSAERCLDQYLAGDITVQYDRTTDEL